jgi:hypothetical protein
MKIRVLQFPTPIPCPAASPHLRDVLPVDLVGPEAAAQPHRQRHCRRRVHGDRRGSTRAVQLAWAGWLLFLAGQGRRNEAVGQAVAHYCSLFYNF